jgi:predicted acetyltransferase
MSDLQITGARPEEKQVLLNLLQLYTHDFSEFWQGLPRGELGPDGRFADYPLESYWTQADHVPLILRAGGHLAGFALVNAASHSGLPADRNMAEFFVVRKHRRGGLGLAAAREVFARFPGLWEVAVARRNVAALAFWRKAIGGSPLARDIQETDISNSAWNGPIIRFQAARSGSSRP